MLGETVPSGVDSVESSIGSRAYDVTMVIMNARFYPGFGTLKEIMPYVLL